MAGNLPNNLFLHYHKYFFKRRWKINLLDLHGMLIVNSRIFYPFTASIKFNLHQAKELIHFYTKLAEWNDSLILQITWRADFRTLEWQKSNKCWPTNARRVLLPSGCKASAPLGQYTILLLVEGSLESLLVTPIACTQWMKGKLYLILCYVFCDLFNSRQWNNVVHEHDKDESKKKYWYVI